MAVVLLIFDLFLPMGMAGGGFYVVLVLIGQLSLDKRLIILAAVIGTVLTLAGFVLSNPGGSLW